MSITDEMFGTPSRLTMDPVHGGIPLFQHEMRVIDHPLFQRLHNVVQNDLLFLVFPGATHSRFSHSIGTMHIAGKLFRSMVRAYLFESARARPDPITPEMSEAIKYFYLCLRLAALLHDTGHGPFSHQFERNSKIQEILEHDKLFDSLWNEINWTEFYDSKPSKVSHEDYSIRCAHQILNEVFSEGDCPVKICDILAIMEKTNQLPSARFVKVSIAFIPLFNQVGSEEMPTPEEDILANIFRDFFRTIISGELDVDKMDYLLRDSYFSGCKYGEYNLDHLVSTIRIGYELNEPWFGIAITQKGLGALEDFVNSRFQLYMNVYGHKTVTGFKWLLEQAIDELFSHDDYRQRITDALANIETFLYFTDTFFWEGFREIAKRNRNSASARLIHRRKLRCLYRGVGMNKSEKKKIRKKFEDKAIETCDVDSDTRFSKIRGTYESVRVLVKDPFTRLRTLEPVKRKTSFFEKFNDVTVTYFYEKPRFC